jgi:hypothetical protein
MVIFLIRYDEPKKKFHQWIVVSVDDLTVFVDKILLIFFMGGEPVHHLLERGYFMFSRIERVKRKKHVGDGVVDIHDKFLLWNTFATLSKSSRVQYGPGH